MKSLLIALALVMGSSLIAPTEAIQTVTVYSGNCIYYKVTRNGTHVMRSPISEGFGKVVIDRSGKKFYLYYKGNLISSAGFDSYIDTRQGGEGFTLDNGATADRYTAERYFDINLYPPIDPSTEWYQYEIENYKVN